MPGQMDWADSSITEKDIGSAQMAIAWLSEKSSRGLIIDSYALEEDEITAAAKCGFTVVFRDGPPYGAEQFSIDPHPGVVSRSGLLAGPGYLPLPELHTTAWRTPKTEQSSCSNAASCGPWVRNWPESELATA